MFYIKKLAKMIFSIFLIGTLSFLLLEMIPGDPASAILGVESTPEDIELLREALGLNKSLIVRYLTWGKGVLAGDFGNSFKYSEPVVDLILKRLPLTLEIALISIGIVFLVSVPLSFLLYKIKNKHVKKIGDFMIGVFISVPSFWLGIIFMFVFGVILRWFSVGYNNTFASLILPCVVIAIPNIGIITSYIKSNLEYEMREEYIKYLYVNGLKMKWLNLYIFYSSSGSFNRNYDNRSYYRNCNNRTDIFYSGNRKAVDNLSSNKRYTSDTGINFLYICSPCTYKFHYRYPLFNY